MHVPLAMAFGSITVSLNFGLGLLVFLIVAAIIGVIAELVMHWHIPGGIAGAIFAGLVGEWFMTNILIIDGVGDIFLAGIPLIRALIGAIIVVAIYKFATIGASRRWSRRRV